jgi:hypothetical protein
MHPLAEPMTRRSRDEITFQVSRLAQKYGRNLKGPFPIPAPQEEGGFIKSWREKAFFKIASILSNRSHYTIDFHILGQENSRDRELPAL